MQIFHIIYSIHTQYVQTLTQAFALGYMVSILSVCVHVYLISETMSFHYVHVLLDIVIIRDKKYIKKKKIISMLKQATLYIGKNLHGDKKTEFLVVIPVWFGYYGL